MRSLLKNDASGYSKRQLFLLFASFILLIFSGKGSVAQDIGIDSDRLSEVKRLLQERLEEKEAYVWYLSHSGYAVKTRSALLIFDYWQKGGDVTDNDEPAVCSLANGRINPEEIEDLDVYVFVSHAHLDHYDQIIFEWEKKVKNIACIFGWKAKEDPRYHYLTGPRSELNIGGMQIATIDETHDGVSGVCFLVKIDGICFYYSGDYGTAMLDSYRKDFEYLSTKTESIDIAFIGPCYYRSGSEWINLEIPAHFIQQFAPGILFPQHYGGREELLTELVEKTRDDFPDIPIRSPKERGERWYVNFGSRKQLHVSRVSTEPLIDGRLDDAEWGREADVDEIFTSYTPTFGEPLPFRTRIWLAHDSSNLYFAFHCLDSEPERIKSSIARRDNIWDDDWIGLSLDTIGSKKFGYGLCVNAKGIQGDVYESSSAGMDVASDYVWYSAGRIVDDGYVAEMKIPLDGFSHRSGKNVEMNIIFVRQTTRLGTMSSWPEVPPGPNLFAGMATVIFDEIDNRQSITTIPSVTYGNIWDRTSPWSWTGEGSATEMGISAAYRLTSSITTEATINPDFSQVESDEFQVLVNQRYPVFYSEKRPFFMEAGKMFDLSASGSNRSLISAAHTRKIVDPAWGAKIDGDIKDFSFGVLAAADSWPGREDHPALFVIGRSKLGFGSENYVGSIFSSRDFSGGYNRAFGGDLFYRFGGGHHFLKAFFLHSISKDENTQEESNGSAFTLSYLFNSEFSDLNVHYEYLDHDFRMDSAFIQRLGISKFTGSMSFRIYPDQQRFSWIKRISPMISGYYLHDLSSDENDYLLKGGLRFDFPKQGVIVWRFGVYREYWRKIPFEGKFVDFTGMVQLTKWMFLGSAVTVGDGIYYDPSSPDLGEKMEFQFQILLQPIQKLSLSFQYITQKMDRKQDGQRLYDVNILISRTTYQVNKYLFLRAMIQYDSYLKTVLTDSLISFTLIPGTVIHLGYGGLYEKLRVQDGQWFREGPLSRYYQTRRSLFFKISYLFQF
jgi:L-ascorbate metabolism protein UlaG (beta-lactamase superfamily)